MSLQTESNGKTPVFLSYSGPACMGCIHFVGEYKKMTCLAYPDGIPPRFKQVDIRHRAIESDQVGMYVFTPTEEWLDYYHKN